MTSKQLIVILGPTAVGKTRVATQVAFQIKGEVISADSRQVYRDMSIGTGKDLSDYEINGQSIPYHLIDIRSPGEPYNLHHFQADFVNAYDDITSRSKKAILCGGTGLYIQAVLEQYRFTAVPINGQLRERLSGYSKAQLMAEFNAYTFTSNYVPDNSTPKRMIRAIEIGEYLKFNLVKEIKITDFEPIIFGLKAERELRRNWITERLKFRLDNGLIEEIKSLLKQGLSKEQLRYYGLEYKFVTDHLDGLFDQQELFEKLNVAIHQFAKRQMTWFRKMERDGYKINWIDASLPTEKQVQMIVDKCCG